MISWDAPLAVAPVTGSVVVPGSKSATARALVLATLAEGTGTLTGALDSRDTSLIRAGLSSLGAVILDDGPRLRVEPATAIVPGTTIECGLAGTAMRFLPPIAALAHGTTHFTGDAQASARPMAGLLSGLEDLGAKVSRPLALPFSLTGGAAVHGGQVVIDSSATSQFVSALLLVAARLPAGLDLRHVGPSLPSLPHIQMTTRMLADRGVEVAQPEECRWVVSPGPIAARDDLVEPDLTNAATVLAAAVITGGRLETAWPQDSLQAADDLAAALMAFGAEVSYQGEGGNRRISVSGPQRPNGAEIDLHAISEFTPAAVAIAALADRPSRITGVGHIRGHETDRLAALAEGLAALGVTATELPDGLAVTPGGGHAGLFRTHADHRLAHAAALLGLVIEGVRLDDVSCTTKTLPDFPGLWTTLVRDQR